MRKATLDLRIRRTRRMSFDAVLTLASRQDFSDITAQDICTAENDDDGLSGIDGSS